jgi:hypothetical protein
MKPAFKQVAAQQPAQVGLYELDLHYVALGPHPEMLGVQVDVVDIKGCQLALPDAGAQQHLDHHPVAQCGESCTALEGLEQALFFRGGQKPGRVAFQSVQLDHPRRIVLCNPLPGSPGKKGSHSCFYPMQ